MFLLHLTLDNIIQKNIYFCFIDYAKAFDCVDHNKLWKILKEMGLPDHLNWLLRNLYAGQEATVITGHGTTEWFQVGKGECQGCISSPWLFNLYAEYIMRNAGLDEVQAGIKIAGRAINNLRYARWNHPYGRKLRGTENPFDENDRGEWKSWLKTQHSENKDPICLFLLLFPIFWEVDHRGFCCDLCRRVFCLCSPLGVL